MIISHKYHFIFLKTTKTAGTSVEIALSKFCGPEDIITPIIPEDEATRKELGYPGAQNFDYPLKEMQLRELPEYLFKGNRKQKFYNHISAYEIRRLIPLHIWEGYTKFAIERNPWDRLVSQYFWQFQSESRPEFSEFINSPALYEVKRKGFGIYSIRGNIVANKILQYEHLNDELEAMRIQLGLPEPLELPHAKAGIRKGKKDYHQYYDQETEKRVEEVFHEEIALFQYQF